MRRASAYIVLGCALGLGAAFLLRQMGVGQHGVSAKGALVSCLKADPYPFCGTERDVTQYPLYAQPDKVMLWLQSGEVPYLVRPPSPDMTVSARLLEDSADAYWERQVRSYNRAESLVDKGEYDKAIAIYDELIRLNPRVAAFYGSRGGAYAFNHQVDKAISDFTEVTRLDPKDPRGYACRAGAHLLDGQLESAWFDVRACRFLGGEVDPRILAALHQASKGD